MPRKIKEIAQGGWRKHSHLAGIIPVIPRFKAGTLGKHPTTIQLSDNFSVTERAVIECVKAGCDSIWLIVQSDFPGELRKNIGDWAVDTVKEENRWDSHEDSGIYNMQSRFVPIFYIKQQHPGMSLKNDIVFNILYAAKFIFDVNTKISYNLAPTKFYVTSPWRVNSIEGLVAARREIVPGYQNFHFSHNGLSVLTNDFLPFTFTPEEQHGMVLKYRILRAEKIYYKINFSDIFTRETKELLLPWSYDISNWQGYRDCLADPNTVEVKRPINNFYRQYLYDPVHEIEGRKFQLERGKSFGALREEIEMRDNRFNVDAVTFGENIPEVKEKIDKTVKKKKNMSYNNFGDEIRAILSDSGFDLEGLAENMSDEEGEE